VCSGPHGELGHAATLGYGGELGPQVPVAGSWQLTPIVASASSTYARTQTYPSGSRAERRLASRSDSTAPSTSPCTARTRPRPRADFPSQQGSPI
jgi:hypothetical protein